MLNCPKSNAWSAHLAGLHLLGAVLQNLAADNGLQVNVQSVTGRHDVVVVNGLDEGLQRKCSGQLSAVMMCCCCVLLP